MVVARCCLYVKKSRTANNSNTDLQSNQKGRLWIKIIPKHVEISLAILMRNQIGKSRQWNSLILGKFIVTEVYLWQKKAVTNLQKIKETWKFINGKGFSVVFANSFYIFVWHKFINEYFSTSRMKFIERIQWYWPKIVFRKWNFCSKSIRTPQNFYLEI